MRGPGEGRLRSETKPLFCSRIGAKACAELTSHSNASDWNVQECLIWLAPRLKGSWGRKRRAGEEKRRLGRHCIIPAAINSLRPEAEWTHHSDRPQAEWHWALSHPSAPPWHGSGFKQIDKATGVYWEWPLAMFDLQISSWLRLTLRADQLLFLKTFFSLSRLHIFVSILISRIVQPPPAIFGRVPAVAVSSSCRGFQEGHVCLHGSLYSVNLLDPVPD